MDLIWASLSEPHSLVAHRAQAQCIMVRSFVVRTYTELFQQWFKSYQLFASHRLFWELSIFIQWFTVNFTFFRLSPADNFSCDMRWNIFFMPNNKCKLEWSVLFTVVSIIKPIAILLYSSDLRFILADTKPDLICHLGWIFCNSVIFL
jgi:hypothetical protein